MPQSEPACRLDRTRYEIDEKMYGLLPSHPTHSLRTNDILVTTWCRAKGSFFRYTRAERRWVKGMLQ